MVLQTVDRFHYGFFRMFVGGGYADPAKVQWDGFCSDQRQGRLKVIKMDERRFGQMLLAFLCNRLRSTADWKA